MPTTSTLLIPGKHAENTQTTQYTAVACTTIIDKFTATNVSGATATISVNLVDGAPPATSNLITDARSIASGETYTFPEMIGQVISASGSISTLASAAASITIRASGREIT